MPNKTVLKELNLRNWAQFKEEKILFSKGDKNVTYFIGKNGAGKTALLNAIFYALFKEQKTAFEIIDTLNKKAILEEEDPLKMEINVIFYKEDEFNQRTTYDISRIWVFDRRSSIDNIRLKNQEEFVGYKIIGDNRQSINEDTFKKEMLDLIPIAVREYYFLDGEQLSGLFDRSKLKNIRTLSLDLSDILKVSALIKLLKTYGKYLHNESKKGGRMGGDTDALMGRINEAQNKKDEFKKHIDEKQEVLDEAVEHSEELYRKIRKYLEKENRWNEHKQLVKEKEEKVRAIEKKTSELNVLLNKDYPLILLNQLGILDWIIHDLEEKNRSGEIPTPIDESIIINILQTGKCICERPLNEETKNFFEELKSNLPTKSLNKSVSEFTNKITREYNEIPNYKAQIFYLQHQLNLLNKQRFDIDDNIDDILNEVGEPSSRVLNDIEIYRGLQNQITDGNKMVTEYKTKLKSAEKKIKDLQNRLKGQITRKEKIGAESKEFLYSKNIDLISILDFLHSGLTGKIRNHIQEATNRTFLKIIWDSYNWSGIEIDEEWKVITIDKDGTPYQNMSAGQNHVLGIAFMSSLTAITKLKIPLVFDSPFGRISEEPIEKIGKFLPSLMTGSQIVLFVTDTENSNIFPYIKNSIGRMYDIKKISASLSQIEHVLSN